MQRDEKAFLLEMLFAAKRVIQFTQAITEDGFMQSELHQSAVARELMVIGEAARQISDVTRKNNPEIEWSAMVGMRVTTQPSPQTPLPIVPASLGTRRGASLRPSDGCHAAASPSPSRKAAFGRGGSRG